MGENGFKKNHLLVPESNLSRVDGGWGQHGVE